MYKLTPYTAQPLDFVMVDVAGTEVAGLAGAFTVNLQHPTGGWVASTGVKSELGNGWYRYMLPVAEAVPGVLDLAVTGAGCQQQNLTYKVKTLYSGLAWPYTITVTGDPLTPIPGVQCWFYTDLAMTQLVWYGTTDTFGVARDEDGDLPYLNPGTYYIRRYKAGYDFTDPDTEVVSNP